MAVENAPRLGDREHIRQIGELKVAQAENQWFPSLEMNAKVSYQSDVVVVALTDPNIPVDFPEVPHDQYGVNLDVRQNLYDGGISRQKKQYEQAITAAELQQVEVDLHGLKPRVNQFFFAILVLQENHRNLETHLETLLARREAVRSAIENGSLLESEIKVIDVEILRIRQSLIEVEARENAQIQALGVLCGADFGKGTVLEVPEVEAEILPRVNRPEHVLFDLTEATMDAGKELLQKKRMPVIFAFGQTGYGKPGYNLLSTKWDFYYQVGAGLKWTICDWNSVSREKEVIENQQRVLGNQRSSFDRELETMLVQEEARIQQYRQAMELEEQVLRLREEITQQAASGLANGTITATDYLTELGKESLARISLSTHGILLKQSITNYLTIQGNL
jgi:outer membrane protein TolC